MREIEFYEENGHELAAQELEALQMTDVISAIEIVQTWASVRVNPKRASRYLYNPYDPTYPRICVFKTTGGATFFWCQDNPGLSSYGRLIVLSVVRGNYSIVAERDRALVRYYLFGLP